MIGIVSAASNYVKQMLQDCIFFGIFYLRFD